VDAVSAATAASLYSCMSIPSIHSNPSLRRRTLCRRVPRAVLLSQLATSHISLFLAWQQNNCIILAWCGHPVPIGGIVHHFSI